MEFAKVFNQAISHKARLDNTKKDFEDNIIRVENYKKELSLMNQLFTTTCIAHEYLEALIKDESTKFVRKLRDLLDYGVKTIFYDEDYSIDIRTNEDTTVIHLITKDEDGNVISPDIKECGGGVRTIVGIMTQLYFIFHYKAERILFIDEGFTQVSSQYIPYLMGLIQNLSERNGLKVLLITHDLRIMSYADKSYEIVKGKAILRKDKGSNITIMDGGDMDVADS